MDPSIWFWIRISGLILEPLLIFPKKLNLERNPTTKIGTKSKQSILPKGRKFKAGVKHPKTALLQQWQWIIAAANTDNIERVARIHEARIRSYCGQAKFPNFGQSDGFLFMLDLSILLFFDKRILVVGLALQF